MPPNQRVRRSKRVYTDRDKAKTYATLVINDFNMYRTSKELGIPNQTIRDWANEWEKSGPPAAIEEEASGIAAEYISDAEEVRSLTLAQIKRLVPSATIKELGALNAIQGTLTDKIDRARGLATSTTEVRHTLPGAEEAAKFVSTFLAATVAMAKEREDIIDVEVVEQADQALPPAST